MNKSIKQAFTLIELLIVIAIIGILSGLIVVSMNNSINSANDAKRKANIDSIRKALVIYSALNGNSYPIESSCNIGASVGSNPCTNLASKIFDSLPVLPKDPVSNSYYTYVSNGTDYTISALLSNSNFYNYSPSVGFSNSTIQIFTTVGTVNWIAPGNCNAVDVLVVAGGGGGGVCYGGGGGGGGVVYYGSESPRAGYSYSVTPGSSYTVTVGAGGNNQINVSGNGGLGGNSVFGTITAYGGGYGGGVCGNVGGNGGSGGGGSGKSAGNTAGGTGISGQGNNGSSSPINEGGGGAGAGGTSGPASRQGGNGLPYSISGSLIYYAGGGSGGGSTLLNGGSGGGGKGGISLAQGVADATVNTGGGGGGSIISSGGTSGVGGSGIVIVHCR